MLVIIMILESEWVRVPQLIFAYVANLCGAREAQEAHSSHSPPTSWS